MFKSERIVKIILFLASLIVIFITAGMVLSLSNGSIPVFKEYGLSFITSSEWNPTEGREAYGALPFIAGTLMTSVVPGRWASSGICSTSQSIPASMSTIVPMIPATRVPL